MSLEIFARQSVAAFMHIYAEVYDGKPIEPDQLEALIWGRLCAKEAGITRMSIKIPYDNIRRSKVTLPYMPDHINYTGCPVIKKNGGLYTPCCGKVAEDSFYCKTCSVDKEGKTKEIEFGTLETREANIDSDEFAPVTYAEWMKAHKTTLPEVYAKLAAQGIQLEIPAEELIARQLPKARRGRKSKPEDDVDADTVKPKRKAKSPAVSPAASDSSSSEDEKPKAKKPAPKPTHKAASPAASDSSSSEDEKPPKRPAPKPKAKSPVASPASSDSEKKKGPAVRPAKEPKAEKKKEAKAPKAEKEAKAPKAEKEVKAPKTEKPKAEKKKEVKAEPAPWTQAEEQPEEFEEEFERENGDKEIDIDGVDYIQRGKVIFTMDGRIVASVAIDDDGEEYPEWTSEER